MKQIETAKKRQKKSGDRNRYNKRKKTKNSMRRFRFFFFLCSWSGKMDI